MRCYTCRELVCVAHQKQHVEYHHETAATVVVCHPVCAHVQRARAKQKKRDKKHAQRVREDLAALDRQDLHFAARCAKAVWIMYSAEIKCVLLILGIGCMLIVLNRLFALINSLPVSPELAWVMFLDCFGLGFFF